MQTGTDYDEEFGGGKEVEKAKPPAPLNVFAGSQSSAVAGNASAGTDQARAIAETQAAMVIAKRFPRDQQAAMDRILNAFTRPSLAEAAQYTYSRGGSDITGPSIRAAEAIAQLWGNLQYGIRELEQRLGESTVEAFAWDVETNTRQTKVFQVPHIRYTKRGSYKLEDPRDVYELIANQGARRLRACILGIIPGDVTESAMQQSDVTLKTKAEVTPERLTALLEKFAEFGVTKEQIEKRIQRKLESMLPAQLVNLGKTYNSLKDGMSVVGDWFETDPNAPATQVQNKSASEGLKAAARKATDKNPGVTFASLTDKFAAARNANDADLLDAHATMIAQLPEDQREGMTAEYKRLRAEIIPA